MNKIFKKLKGKLFTSKKTAKDPSVEDSILIPPVNDSPEDYVFSFTKTKGNLLIKYSRIMKYTEIVEILMNTMSMISSESREKAIELATETLSKLEDSKKKELLH